MPSERSPFGSPVEPISPPPKPACQRAWVEAPGTAPGSERLISMPIYRRSPPCERLAEYRGSEVGREGGRGAGNFTFGQPRRCAAAYRRTRSRWRNDLRVLEPSCTTRVVGISVRSAHFRGGKCGRLIKVGSSPNARNQLGKDRFGLGSGFEPRSAE
jgi:hypothetical protein